MIESTFPDGGFHVYVYGAVPALILITIFPLLLPVHLTESTTALMGRPVPRVIVAESVIEQNPGPLIWQIYVVVPVAVTVGVANPGPVPDGGAVAVDG
jgi:hypothetical protein